MFNKWIDSLKSKAQENPEPKEYWVERLTALLLVEIARSDTNIDLVEIKTIEKALQASSPTMSASDIEYIIATATNEADESISLHEQFRHINESFSREEKQALVEQMWRVALADGDVDKYEEYTIRELSERLYLSHKYFIQAKLKVMSA